MNHNFLSNIAFRNRRHTQITRHSKPTQTAKIQNHIATGDTLRELSRLEQDVRRGNVATASLAKDWRAMLDVLSAAGIELAQVLSRGELVPDEVMNKLVQILLLGADTPGYLLDGYPRTQDQACHLQFGSIASIQPQLVISLIVPDEELKRRRAQRAKEQNRSDDSETTFAKRLALFHEQCQQLVPFYEGLGIMEQVDGMGAPEEVCQRVLDVLQRRLPGVAGT